MKVLSQLKNKVLSLEYSDVDDNNNSVSPLCV